MSDNAIEIDFEEPPPIARRSVHLPLLLALKGHPGESARIQKDAKLDAAGAAQLAGAVTRAADKIGNGFEVVTRFIPAVDHHGVWVTYNPAPDDDPATPEEKAVAEAREMVADAAAEWYPDAPIPAESSEIVGDGSGEAPPPIVDDTEWELPERSGVKA